MNTSALRQQLHEYIDNANDKKIQGLFLLVEDEISEQSSFQLSKEEIEILDQERQKHVAGETQSYTWEEAKAVVRKGDKA